MKKQNQRRRRGRCHWPGRVVKEMEVVLLTGAAGQVGSILRQHWGARYRLKLADLPQPTAPTGGRPRADLRAGLRGPHESVCEFDCADAAAFRRECEGVDCVVHLAADPSPGADFATSLLSRNIVGGYNAFDAAAASPTCRRIVFASSINAVRGYAGEARKVAGIDQRADPGVHWDDPINPPNVYGATKCFGESLARVFSNSHGLSCLCVRLGHPGLDMSNLAEGNWDVSSGNVSPRDCAQLFGCCVDAPLDIRFAILHGSSQHASPMMSIEHTKQLVGYRPQDGTAFAQRAPRL